MPIFCLFCGRSLGCRPSAVALRFAPVYFAPFLCPFHCHGVNVSGCQLFPVKCAREIYGELCPSHSEHNLKLWRSLSLGYPRQIFST